MVSLPEPSSRASEGLTLPAQETEGQVNRLSTFFPSRPDLSGTARLAQLPGQQRNVLAPPSVTARPSTTDLPKVLHGGAGVTANVDEDGAIRFHDARNLGYDPVTWAGRLDITDMAMRMAGQDPYAAVKRKMADETREQRICMAKHAQDQRQSQALLGLSAKVRELARRVDLTPPARRQLVFEIWDECAEGAGDRTADYGAMARATIFSVIREAFPAGTDLGYQPAELVALNQRRSSHEKFAPYERGVGGMKQTALGGAAGADGCP